MLAREISGDLNKLKSIRDKIEEYSKKNPALLYHISCMNMILDDEMLANRSLQYTTIR